MGPRDTTKGIIAPTRLRIGLNVSNLEKSKALTFWSFSITIKRAPRLPMLSSCASFFDMEPHFFEPLRLDKARSVKIRHNRQKPAREPYSYIDSILAWRCPGHGCTPNTSDRNASEARSPCKMLFSPPSSKFTTNCTATRAPPGQRGSGGLRP